MQRVQTNQTRRHSGRRHHSSANKFYWIFQESDVYDDKEILFVDNRSVIREGTTIEQAKREVQSFIRSIGGNTAMHLNVEKTSAPKTSWAYYPARYSVSANAALVVPRSMREEKKDELCSHLRAMAGAVRFENPRHAGSILLYIPLLLSGALILLWVYQKTTALLFS